jgi:hypothetical protein
MFRSRREALKLDDGDERPDRKQMIHSMVPQKEAPVAVPHPRETWRCVSFLRFTCVNTSKRVIIPSSLKTDVSSFCNRRAPSSGGDVVHSCEGGTIRKLHARAIRRFVARPLIAHAATSPYG